MKNKILNHHAVENYLRITGYNQVYYKFKKCGGWTVINKLKPFAGVRWKKIFPQQL